MSLSLHARAGILAVALLATAHGQAAPIRFEPLLENRQVSVFSLELPPGRSASVFQNTRDIFWIAISAGRVIASDRDGNKDPIAFRPGDARFFPSFHSSSILNDGSKPFRAVLVQIKPRGLASSCDCDGAAQRAVCGCARATPLPAMWAVGVGRLVLGGATLAPGESFQQTTERGDMLMIAISPLKLSDGATFMNLAPGGAHWLEHGLHNFRNNGAAPARYVTLEF